MARDNIKAIIERGLKIPASKAINSSPKPKAKRGADIVSRSDIAEKPKQRAAVTGHRTLTGIRR